MRRSLLTALLAALLMLSLPGCGSLLERSYASVTPHTQFSDESVGTSTLGAETYQGLVSALLHLVEEGEETGAVRLYQYSSVTGSAASDVDRACQEVTREDPIGAYAVEYIRYDVQQTAAYYQVDVDITYRVPPEELTQVISVTASTAVARELQDLLPHQPSKVIFRIGYFTQEDSAASLRQAVEEAYAAQTLPLPQLTDIQVNLYPENGQQRVAEILLTWADRAPAQNFSENGEISLDTAPGI